MAPAIADPLTTITGWRVLGHRGAPVEAPENTLVGFDAALAHDVDAVELDVRVTADDVPIVLHDPTTGRTAERDLRANISSYAALAELDAGYRFTPDGGGSHPFRGRGVRIPTLEAVLDRLSGIPLLLDIKSSRGGEAVRRVLDRAAAAERVVVASTRAAALRPFRGAGYRLGASRRDVARLLAATAMGVTPRRVPYHLMSVPPRYGILSLTGRRMLAATTRLGVPVHVWTIDDPAAAARLWAGGVTGIVTNDPGGLIPVRDAGRRTP